MESKYLKNSNITLSELSRAINCTRVLLVWLSITTGVMCESFKMKLQVQSVSSSDSQPPSPLLSALVQTGGDIVLRVQSEHQPEMDLGDDWTYFKAFHIGHSFILSLPLSPVSHTHIFPCPAFPITLFKIL